MTNELTDKQFADRLLTTILLRQQGYYDSARRVAMDLVADRYDHPGVWHQFGQIWTSMGEFSAALQCFEQAVYLIKQYGTFDNSVVPFQTSAMGLAQSLMRFGRFSEAWPLWEAGRLGISWNPQPTTQYWDGTGQPDRLLVQAEGGYGDIFMFLRWLPLLKSQKLIPRVGVTLFPALKDFCDWKSLGVDEVYTIGEDKIPFGKWQFATSFMSLPVVFGVDKWKDIPERSFPPLFFPPVRSTARRRFAPLRIGFCWRAEENTSPIKTKSLTAEVAANICARLLDSTVLPDVSLFSLSPERADLYNDSRFAQPTGLAHEPDRLASWQLTAAYIYSMDFILTVDTAVAHLAGLLGVPTLVLLPKSSCWRWGLLNDSCHWYGSLKLYRQPVPLKWDVEAIVSAIRTVIEDDL